MFNQRKKRFKARSKPAAAEEEPEPAELPPLQGKAKKKKKKKRKERTKGSLLSFGDDAGEEADAPRLKKVANPAVKALRSERERETASSGGGGGGGGGGGSASGGAGMYSAESLRALQESSFSYGGGHVPVFKPEDAPPEDDEPVAALSEGAMAPGGAEGEGDGDGVGDSIPDASAIQRAREKRERLRTQGDYIPLGSQGAGAAAEEDGAEEDEDDDGDDLIGDAGGALDQRVVFKGAATPRAAGKRAEVEAALADGADFYGGDDELRRLEADHVRSAATGATGRSTLELRDTSRVGGLRGQSQRQSLLKEIRADAVCQTLHSALREQEEALGRHQRELVTNAEAAKLSVADVKSLESKLGALEPKYRYLQELWEYVDSMTSCLDSKMDLIHECEVQLLELEKTQAEAAAARRWLLLDDLADTLGGVSTQPKARGGDLDEFGRDRGHSTAATLSAGAAKRAEARAAMVSKLRATDSSCDSDQEDPSEGGAEEQERVRGDKAEVLQAASVIFADAAEEFSTVGAVATRMEEWKRKQPRSYQDTYVSLSLLKIFLPFVRLEVLGWHPSDRCAEALAKQRWFAALESYGMGDGEVAADDADLDLIPKLVEKGLLPRLKEWLRSGWDPLSRGSTDMALECVQELAEVYVTVEKPAMAEVLALVLNRLQATAERLRIPTGAAGEVQQRGAIANYLFNRATVFVGGARRWARLLATSPLEALISDVVGNTLCPVLACVQTIPLERSGAEWLPKLERLVAALQDHSKGGDANAWLQATTTLRHVVRTAVTASPRLQALSADDTAGHQRLAASLP